MILLVLMALLGAVLGAFIRPRLIAVPVAIGLAEGVRGLVGFAAPIAIDNLQAPNWAQISLRAVEDPLAGYIPLLVVSAGAAAFAALLAHLTNRDPPKPTTLAEATALQRRVRNGRYVRASNMIEERPVQSEAERRQKSILGL